MSNFALKAPPTRRTLERDRRDTSLAPPISSTTLQFGGLRTLRAKDKIVDTSISRKDLRNDVTGAENEETAVQDVPSAPRFSDHESFEVDDRARRIAALLLRREALEMLARVLTTDDPSQQRERLGDFLLSSHDALYSFSRLVADGGLTAADGRLQTTPLMDRILKAISENTTS
jgi:hypothetical protein